MFSGSLKKQVAHIFRWSLTIFQVVLWMALYAKVWSQWRRSGDFCFGADSVLEAGVLVHLQPVTKLPFELLEQLCWNKRFPVQRWEAAVCFQYGFAVGMGYMGYMLDAEIFSVVHLGEIFLDSRLTWELLVLFFTPSVVSSLSGYFARLFSELHYFNACLFKGILTGTLKCSLKAS